VGNKGCVRLEGGSKLCEEGKRIKFENVWMCMEDGNEGCLRLEDGTGLYAKGGFRVGVYFMYGGRE
jgi:hypothetical protein